MLLYVDQQATISAGHHTGDGAETKKRQFAFPKN